ncbi:MAG: DUF5018 domain-containing protein [Tannerella sp.]|nr:DUF5018 domain-containing protein [Tannerella sp.]
MKFRFLAAMMIATAVFTSCDPKDDPIDTGTEQDADIVAFSFDGIDGKATIDRAAFTVTAKAGETVDLTAVVAEFTLSKGATAKVGNTAQVSGVTANNFSGPVTYRVTSGDGLTANDWTVTVVIEKKPVEAVMQDMALTGTVYDTGGNPLGGVSVVTGTLSATTGNDGKFMFEKAGTVDRRAIICFSKSGYFTLTRSGLKEDEMTVHAVLKRKGNTDASLQTSFNAGESKTLSVGGMKAQIPASALVKADGTPYSGSVTADMLYLDPNDGDFAETMPGGDLAAIRSDNSETQLISYGMTEITLTDDAGNPLQLQDGASSELAFPIPAGMENNPPATIPL